MRNYITPEHCPLSDAAIEARQVSSVANSNQRLELVHNDRLSDAEGNRVGAPSAVVSSDFQGFGSFAS